MIELRDHAERVDNMPVLFDESRRGAEVPGDPFNEVPVQLYIFANRMKLPHDQISR